MAEAASSHDGEKYSSSSGKGTDVKVPGVYRAPERVVFSKVYHKGKPLYKCLATEPDSYRPVDLLPKDCATLCQSPQGLMFASVISPEV